MIAIIDYGVGNLFSLQCSFGAIGKEARVTADPEILRAADKLILPGVGAFGDASRKLRETGLGSLLTEEAAKGKPVLGICLGMQLLFSRGEEYGVHEGLGLLPGYVRAFRGVLPEGLKIPHIGWNALQIRKDCPILKYIRQGECMYFVHSFFADDCGDALIASTEYGIEVPAVVGKGAVFGCQFHPEKSGAAGLSILKAFAEL